MEELATSSLLCETDNKHHACRPVLVVGPNMHANGPKFNVVAVLESILHSGDASKFQALCSECQQSLSSQQGMRAMCHPWRTSTADT